MNRSAVWTIVTLLLLMSSCAQDDTREDLFGIWHLEELKYEECANNRYNELEFEKTSIRLEHESERLDITQKFIIELSEDGTSSITNIFRFDARFHIVNTFIEEEGSWVYDNNQVRIDSENGLNFTFNLALESNEMIFVDYHEFLQCLATYTFVKLP